MSYLNKAKRNLAARATEIFTDMRGDLQFEEYKDHFADLGAMLSSIDQIETWSEMLQKILKGDFQHIGMFPEEDEALEEFLADIFGKSVFVKS